MLYDWIPGRGYNIQATQNRGGARQVGGEDAQAMLFIVEHPNPSHLNDALPRVLHRMKKKLL